jgi:hypothetical protein
MKEGWVEFKNCPAWLEERRNNKGRVWREISWKSPYLPEDWKGRKGQPGSMWG